LPLAAAVSCALGLPPAFATQALTQADVQGVISKAVAAATAHGYGATIAVVDRTGMVLAVWQVAGTGAHPLPDPVMVANNPNGPNLAPPSGLNGLFVPAAAVAIAKAITGAYLSSSHGNAFSSRTASQIIQDHFNPGTLNAPSGPLYGVQFSQLPCADLMVRLDPSGQTPGPHRSPLGLAADPGGLPLYKGGDLVGGIGVKSAGPYGLDLDIHVNDDSVDEAVALAGSAGLTAPSAIQASTITVGGLLLRYTDPPVFGAASGGDAAPPAAGNLMNVPGYFDANLGILAGTTYETPASGLAPDTSGEISEAHPPDLLITCPGGQCKPRYPIIAGEGPAALSQSEVLSLLRNAYAVALETRAQIRNPPGSAAAVTISVVDIYGRVLGIVSVPDAPVFGIDVSLQKARTAAFFSDPFAGAVLDANATSSAYGNAADNFFHTPVFSRNIAWSARAIGTIARDTYPDGIDSSPNGPLGLPAKYSNPFAVGLELNLIAGNILSTVGFIDGTAADTPDYCTTLPIPQGQPAPVLADGAQIFPGGFPIYRGNTLVGGIGVSGDGVDQDDLIAFLGLYYGAAAANTGIGEAPANARASLLSAYGISPRYVNCPYAPFLNGGGTNVCNGK
jgi:uncharacterized protein GlcG (DUF336 family)